MSKRIGKLMKDGVELISYVPTAGRISSPMTIPQWVVDAVAVQFFGPLQAPAGIGCHRTRDHKEIAPHIFQQSGPVEVSEVLRLPAQSGDPSYMSRWDAVSGRRVSLEWVCVEDYSA